jgi:hypothetical protein
MVTLESGNRQEGFKASMLQAVAVRRVVVTDVPYIAGSVEPAPEMKACLMTTDFKNQCTEPYKY